MRNVKSMKRMRILGTIFCTVCSIILIACQAGASLGSPSLNELAPTASQGSVADPVSRLVLPVCDVSPQYAEAAQKILDSFYCAQGKIPDELLTGTFENQYAYPDDPYETKYRYLSQWCYPIGSLDFYYFIRVSEVVEALQSGKKLPDVIAINEEYQNEYYGGDGLTGVLYTREGEDTVLGEAEHTIINRKGKYQEEISLVSGYYWEPGPVSALYLDDALMASLEAENFVLEDTKAMSVLIPGNSCGVYFSDGNTERYYPQTLLRESSHLPVLKQTHQMYTIAELVESFQ